MQVVYSKVRCQLFLSGRVACEISVPAGCVFVITGCRALNHTSPQQTHTNTSSDGNSNGSSDAAAMSTGEFSRATEDAYKKLTEALSHVISSLFTVEAVDGAAGSVSDAVNEVSSYFASPELSSLHGAQSAYQSTHPMAVW